MIDKIKRAMNHILIRSARKANYKFVMKDWIRLFDLKACSEVLETKRFSQNLRPVEMECPDKNRVLVIAPHPDDGVFGAGGTIMKSISRGADVHVMYVTAGTDDFERAKSIRSEAAKVCDALGTHPVFLGCQTKRIPLNDNAVNTRVTSLFKELKPQVIFIPFLLDDHDDHRRVNQLLLKITENQKLRNIELWAYQIYSTVIPNVVVNITDYVQRKKEIMKIWKSVPGDRDWAHYVLGMNAANCRYLSSKEPLYAETFFVVPIEEYLTLCERYFSHPPSEIYYSPAYGSQFVQ